MPIKTNALAWWDSRIDGWRCAQCDEPLNNVAHVCPIDEERTGRVTLRRVA